MENEENLKVYRIAGYFVLIFTILGIIGMVGAFVYSHHRKVDVLYCEFPYIGDLKFDDPFTINGKQVGVVNKIWANEPNRAVLTINLHAKVEIHEGYRLFIGDVGIMGERLVCLENGPSDAPLIDLRDTLHGLYYPGISDMLGRIMELRELLDEGMAFMDKIKHGTDTARSIVEWLNSAEGSIDKLTQNLQSTLFNWDSDIPELLEQIDNLNYNINSGILTLGEKLPEILEITDVIIENCDTLLAKIAKAERLSDDIENIIGKIDELDVNSINNTLRDMQEGITSISRDAHRLRLLLLLRKARN
jgi:ABC-type transporter Mla subunit MlaD